MKAIIFNKDTGIALLIVLASALVHLFIYLEDLP